MTLQLLYIETSPYSRMARIVAFYKGISLDLVRVNPRVREAQHMAVNELGQIPVLRNEVGEVLNDSRVICQFLDDAFSIQPHKLHSTNWASMNLYLKVLDMIGNVILSVVELKQETQNQTQLEAYRGKIMSVLDHLNDRCIEFSDRPLAMEHVALGCALDYLSLRIPEFDWQTEFPAIADWHAEFCQQPFMISTACDRHMEAVSLAETDIPVGLPYRFFVGGGEQSTDESNTGLRRTLSCHF